MIQKSDLVRGLELHDSSGAKLGVFLPEEQLQELLAERDALRAQLALQQQELSRLRDIERERDTYLQFLHFMTRPNVLLTEQELTELKNGVPGEQVLAEMEQILSVKEDGANHV